MVALGRGPAKYRRLLSAVTVQAIVLLLGATVASANSPNPQPSGSTPTPTASAVSITTAAPAANPTVPLSKFDCNLLAARKLWTGIKTCSPPPACPVEDAATASYAAKKGPYWCNKDGNVTVLYLNFKKIKPSRHAGTLPTAWGFFRSLRILTVMANNKLRGRVPGSFSELSTLSELDLGFNPNLRGGIPKKLASSDTLSQLRIASSGIRGKQKEFNRKNFNGNPLLLIVSKSRPEICQDFRSGYPILVQAVYWSAAKSKYLGATLPMCK